VRGHERQAVSLATYAPRSVPLRAASWVLRVLSQQSQQSPSPRSSYHFLQERHCPLLISGRLSRMDWSLRGSS
jgi:hypothetical protein